MWEDGVGAEEGGELNFLVIDDNIFTRFFTF